MIKKYKPDKSFYQYILRYEGYKPEETIFIGDSLIDDIAGPRSIGIKTILVDRGKKFNLAENIQPDYIINDLSEIEKICL